MENKDGGPAFPHIVDPRGERKQGMTLRDYFAAHFPITMSEIAMLLNQTGKTATAEAMMEAMAAVRFAYSDAMIKAREKGGA